MGDFCTLFFGGFFDSGEEGILDVLLFLLGWSLGEFDIDFVAGELGSKANILALLADGDRLLIFGDINFGLFAINLYLGDFGWT